LKLFHQRPEGTEFFYKDLFKGSLDVYCRSYRGTTYTVR